MHLLLKLMACAAGAEAVAHATLVPVKLGDNEDIPVYVGGEADAPSIIVIQEWWGVDRGTMQKALRLAQHGYRVLVPDIYKGKKGINAEEASHLMGELDFPKAIEEISIAAQYLKKTGSPAVGVVGFCMGGALTLIVASEAEAAALVACAASFYGVPGADACDFSRVACPLQAHFGEEDTLEGFSDPSAAKRLEDALTSAGDKRFEILRYPRVGHAFLNDLPEPFADFDAREKAQGFPPRDEAVVAEAWANLEKFFDEHLGEKKE